MRQYGSALIVGYSSAIGSCPDGLGMTSKRRGNRAVTPYLRLPFLR
jgi:hypothetical protein